MVRYLLSRYSEVCVSIQCGEYDEKENKAVGMLRDMGATVYVNRRSRGTFAQIQGRLKRWWDLAQGRMPSMASRAFLDRKTVKGFIEVCMHFQPHVVMIYHVSNSGLRYHLPAAAITIVDTIDVYKDLHYAYYDRKGLRAILAPILLGYREKGILYESEDLALKHYDAVIAISPDDHAKYIASGLPRERVHILSACINTEVDSPTASLANKDYDLLFIASHFAGTERAVRFLLEDVGAQLSQVVRVAIVGSIGGYLRENLVNHSSKIILSIEGIVPDVEPYYRLSRIVVVPVLEGTGTSVKTMEAFAFGACVITTSAGARIEGVEDGVNCLIQDDAKSFAQAIQSLLADPDRRSRLGTKAWETAQARFCPGNAYRTLDGMFESLALHSPWLAAERGSSACRAPR